MSFNEDSQEMYSGYGLPSPQSDVNTLEHDERSSEQFVHALSLATSYKRSLE